MPIPAGCFIRRVMSVCRTDCQWPDMAPVCRSPVHKAFGLSRPGETGLGIGVAELVQGRAAGCQTSHTKERRTSGGNVPVMRPAHSGETIGQP
jgi:hypothetical protein